MVSCYQFDREASLFWWKYSLFFKVPCWNSTTKIGVEDAVKKRCNKKQLRNAVLSGHRLRIWSDSNPVCQRFKMQESVLGNGTLATKQGLKTKKVKSLENLFDQKRFLSRSSCILCSSKRWGFSIFVLSWSSYLADSISRGASFLWDLLCLKFPISWLIYAPLCRSTKPFDQDRNPKMSYCSNTIMVLPLLIKSSSPHTETQQRDFEAITRHLLFHFCYQ